jgi:hypothetical protein
MLTAPVLWLGRASADAPPPDRSPEGDGRKIIAEPDAGWSPAQHHEVRVDGQVKGSGPSIEGEGIDQEEFRKFIRARIPSVRACYERELKKNPTLKGKVVAQFIIQPNGLLSDVGTPQNTTGSGELASCIQALIRSWVTPFKPTAGVKVAYPFVFNTAE